MPRKILIRSHDYPYHIVNRTNDRDFYNLPLSEVYNLFEDHLRIATWVFGAKVHAFVLMSNHYHLIISTPYKNVDDIMEYLQSNISRDIKEKTQSKKFRFTARYKWTLLTSNSYYLNTYRYVYQNPIRAGLCNHAEEYPYSTFAGKMGESHLGVPIYPHNIFMSWDKLQDEYDWVNQMLNKQEVLKTRWALKKCEYKEPCKKTFDKLTAKL